MRRANESHLVELCAICRHIIISSLNNRDKQFVVSDVCEDLFIVPGNDTDSARSNQFSGEAALCQISKGHCFSDTREDGGAVVYFGLKQRQVVAEMALPMEPQFGWLTSWLVDICCRKAGC